MRMLPHSRRAFLAGLAAAPLVLKAAFKDIPIGLELYSVRDMMKEDEIATVKAVAKLGYDYVEFYGPYMMWTPDRAREMRKVLDDTGLKCHSTHNSHTSFDPENINKAIELNKIIGSSMIIMASAGRVENGIDGWKGVAEKLAKGSEKMKAAGLAGGFHNHKTEFVPINGVRPMEVLAQNTPKDVILQLDVGTCVEAGYDPVQWIRQNPGRFRSIHCKEYSKEKGFRVLFGDGDSPWKQIFEAAESVGGVEGYLIEQEGYSEPSIVAAEKCLQNIRKMRA
jgi:sugar phosphate isomerase/epimerase